MNSIDILNSVEQFYNSAWNKLIVFTSILVAFVGVIIPLLLTWWQNRTLKIREETVKKELETFFESKIKEIEKNLNENINSKFDDRLEEIKSEIDQKIATVEAGIFHVQGNNNLRDKQYKEAIIDFTIAGYGYLEGKDLLNLGRINNLIKNNLEYLSKEELQELEDENTEPSDYIQRLVDNNDNDLFSDLISELKITLTKIKNNKAS